MHPLQRVGLVAADRRPIAESGRRHRQVARSAPSTATLMVCRKAGFAPPRRPAQHRSPNRRTERTRRAGNETGCLSNSRSSQSGGRVPCRRDRVVPGAPRPARRSQRFRVRRRSIFILQYNLVPGDHVLPEPQDILLGSTGMKQWPSRRSAEFRRDIAARVAEGLIDDSRQGDHLAHVRRRGVVGDVEQAGKPRYWAGRRPRPAGRARRNTLTTGNTPWDCARNSPGLLRTANRQMLAWGAPLPAGAGCRPSEVITSRSIHVRTSGGAVRICSEVSVIPIMIWSPWGESKVASIRNADVDRDQVPARSTPVVVRHRAGRNQSDSRATHCRRISGICASPPPRRRDARWFRAGPGRARRYSVRRC